MADKEQLAAEVARLTEENQALADELARTQKGIVAEKGPPVGTKVCYHRGEEPFCRPARVASEGFTERVPGPGGMAHTHCLIEYGEPPWISTASHTFQTDRAYSPSGGSNTWHFPEQCPRQGGPGCPYAPSPIWPPPQTE